MITGDSSLGALVWDLGRTCVTSMDVSAQLGSVVPRCPPRCAWPERRCCCPDRSTPAGPWSSRPTARPVAEYEFVSSVVVPLETVGGRLGGLQLFGDFWRPVESRHADLIRPLVEVLVARLVDVRTIRMLTDAASNASVRPIEVLTQAAPQAPADVATIALPVSLPVDAVPHPRRSRHSRPRS